MKKQVLSLLMAGVMAFSLMGCTSSGNNGPKSASTKQQETSAKDSSKQVSKTVSAGNKVGISMPTKTLERWNRDGSYLENKFKEAGHEVFITYSDNKIDQQVKDIEGLIADNVNLLIVAAIDGESLSQVLNQAKEKNIPVVAYDRLIMNTDAISYYISFDNYKVGTIQGEFIKNKLDLDNAGDKKYNIELTGGDPADNNAKFFFGGAIDVLKPYIDKGILVVPSGQTEFEQCGTAQWDTSKALSRFQNILGSYYSDGKVLDAALCSNDSTALGVTQALSSDYAGTNEVIITGQDGDEPNLANIIDGKQSMTVYKAVANEAIATLSLGEAILKGETVDASLIEKAKWSFEASYNTESYDNGTGKIPSFLLVPVAVTKENIQKELIDTGYYTMGSDGYPHPVN